MSHSPSRGAHVRGILLDIEGTTSSIDFVYEVMFPYARSNFSSFLEDHFESESVQSTLPLLAADLGFDSPQALYADCCEQGKSVSPPVAVHQALMGLMDDDVKSTGLKKLQGLVWESGFRNGEMVAHLYPDVAPAIAAWRAEGLDLRIYSSGSIYAQKLFFGHSVAGNLLPQFSGHYDTTIGHKQDPNSYQKIADDWMPAESVLFISDVAQEIDAAADAGMKVLLSDRPGNKPVDNSENYIVIKSFKEVSNFL